MSTIDYAIGLGCAFGMAVVILIRLFRGRGK